MPTYREGMENFVTVYTDASIDDKTRIGAWAAWIKIGTGSYPIRVSGVFKGDVRNSTEAELKAIANAVHKIRAMLLPQHIIVVTTDSDSAIRYLKHQRPKRGFNKHCKDIADLVHATIPKGAKLRINKVKGHSNGTDSRSVINRAVDTECRRLMREERDKYELFLKKQLKKVNEQCPNPLTIPAQ